MRFALAAPSASGEPDGVRDSSGRKQLNSDPDTIRRMLDEARLEAYRKMSPAERWREVEALMTFAWRTLKQLPREEVERRLAIDRKWHDDGDEIILAHLRRFP
jgi:hypothetical protein